MWQEKLVEKHVSLDWTKTSSKLKSSSTKWSRHLKPISETSGANQKSWAWLVFSWKHEEDENDNIDEHSNTRKIIKASSIAIDIETLKWNIQILVDRIIFLEEKIWDLKETNLYKQKCFDYHNSISLDVNADVLEDHLFYLILEHKKKALFSLLNRVLTSIEKLNLKDYRNVYYEAWYIFPLSNELNPNLLIKN